MGGKFLPLRISKLFKFKKCPAVAAVALPDNCRLSCERPIAQNRRCWRQGDALAAATAVPLAAITAVPLAHLGRGSGLVTH